MWMNRYEITEALGLDAEDFPVALKAARILDRLRHWADSNSDGWHSWPKPGKAADRLMVELKAAMESRYRHPYDADITEADLRRALTPIKSFLTKQGVDHSLILDDPAPAEVQHMVSVVLVQREIDALLTLSSNAGLSPSAWLARQIMTAVA